MGIAKEIASDSNSQDDYKISEKFQIPPRNGTEGHNTEETLQPTVNILKHWWVVVLGEIKELIGKVSSNQN